MTTETITKALIEADWEAVQTTDKHLTTDEFAELRRKLEAMTTTDARDEGLVAEEPSARYEAVALTGGIQGDVRARCGHHHRTEEAAEKCLAKLSASHEEVPGVRVSSLLWYHGRVRPVVR